jgi:hypothetical protein
LRYKALQEHPHALSSGSLRILIKVNAIVSLFHVQLPLGIYQTFLQQAQKTQTKKNLTISQLSERRYSQLPEL